MTKITSKSTKAEILAAYEALQVQRTTWMDALNLALETAQTVGNETRMLAEDVYNAGSSFRRAVSDMLDILRRPIVKW